MWKSDPDFVGGVSAGFPCTPKVDLHKGTPKGGAGMSGIRGGHQGPITAEGNPSQRGTEGDLPEILMSGGGAHQNRSHSGPTTYPDPYRPKWGQGMLRCS